MDGVVRVQWVGHKTPALVKRSYEGTIGAGNLRKNNLDYVNLPPTPHFGLHFTGEFVHLRPRNPVLEPLRY